MTAPWTRTRLASTTIGLTSGLAGFEVRDGGFLGVATRFPLRPAVEDYAPRHGRADLLSAQEKDDLVAYVMSL